MRQKRISFIHTEIEDYQVLSLFEAAHWPKDTPGGYSWTVILSWCIFAKINYVDEGASVRYLVTGAAGFIGTHLTIALAESGHEVIAVDNLSDYYSVELKKARISQFNGIDNIIFENMDLGLTNPVRKLFSSSKFHSVFHLAAQPGVRLPLSLYSKYVYDNLVAYENVFSNSIEHSVQNFLYASSSSVYGNLSKSDYSETDFGLKPVSFYGATKLANEFMASTLVQGSVTKARGLRFFTVYGPWGRPDMAYFRIISNALTGSPFSVFGDGNVTRDFTYIDDVVDSVIKLNSELDGHKEGFSDIVNIGGGKPCSLNQMISQIDIQLGRDSKFQNESFNPNDVFNTKANTSYLVKLIGSKPEISLEVGIKRVIDWANNPTIRENLSKWISSVS